MSDTPNDRREFRCNHCGGRILIPWDLPPTTGPCPHCQATITSPAADALSSAVAPAAEVAQAPSAEAAVAAATEATQAPPAPIAPIAPVEPTVQPLPQPETQPVPQAAPQPVAAPVRQSEEKPVPEPPRRPKSDVFPPIEPKSSRSGVIVALIVAALLVGGAAVMSFWLAKQQSGKQGGRTPAGGETGGVDPARQKEIDESRYIRVGWVADAQSVLNAFIAARTPEEKAKHVLGGEKLMPVIHEFYGGGMIDDRDTPAETFSAFDLAEEDRRRGIFLMTYDLPPQFELGTFFRPLAPLKVQLGVEEPDLLLSTFARVANFSSEPVRVHGFFKRTPAGMKLDWETFVQTKYRTLRSFVEAPEPGRSQVFRVILMEDVPEAGVGSKGSRTYRLVDPVNFSDSARVEVPVDTEIGRVLSAVNWRGAGGVKAVPKTATLEIGWEGGEAPRLRIQRFLCWEFLGLGGSEGNTEPNGGR